VTTYAAAITHVYDLLIGDLTLAGLIDEAAPGETAIYSGGLAGREAPKRFVVIEVISATDISAQGQLHLASHLVAVSVYGDKWEELDGAAGRIDTLLMESRSVKGGKPVTCERVSLRATTDVDDGRTRRQMVAVYRVYVAAPV